ncbi:LuxR family transcriptional regulator [Pararhodospirillum oryzae]|uniref:LuxR family transcriptional regulator n=1 Tax=Pararhodospirillum oryzae TaxID=478448 RepID=A0A512H3F1_9PROT|nr:LuxR family transcriptional regulator [Pararhodospirillum oryzae]
MSELWISTEAPLDLAVEDFTARLRNCATAGECWTQMRETFDRLGFPHVSYGGVFSPHLRADLHRETLYRTHFPADFVTQYEQNEHLRHDIVVQWAFRFDQPASWRHLRTRLTHARREEAVWRDALAFGVRNGVSVPLRFGRESSPGGLFLSATGLGDEDWDELTRHYGPSLILMAYLFHDAMQKFPLFDNRLNPHDRVVQLSDRERDCLLWAARGCQVSEMADHLRLAERTIEHRLRSARRKLSARTTAQAVARALSLGLLRSNAPEAAMTSALWESAISETRRVM